MMTIIQSIDHADPERNSAIWSFVNRFGHNERRALSADFSRFLKDRGIDFGLAAGSAPPTETCLSVLMFLLASYMGGRVASVSDIYLSAGVSKSSAIRWVAKLAERNLIRRDRDKADRRRSVIMLDKAFADVLAAFVDRNLQVAAFQPEAPASTPMSSGAAERTDTWEGPEKVLVAAFENAGFGIVVKRAVGPQRLVNRKMAEILGYSIGELSGIKMVDLGHPDDKEALRRGLSGVMSGHADAFRTETRLMRKDGKVVRAFVQLTVARDNDGNVLQHIGIFQPLDRQDSPSTREVA